MQVSPVSDSSTPAPSAAATPSPAPSASTNASTAQAASNAFGLSFESLLKIILTQLTYQDPLKPMDNFEFVSQLAQFSQLQIGQTTNDRLSQLTTAASNSQATSLLGAKVDVPAGAGTLTGIVESISFADGQPQLTIKTTDGQTISGIALGTISRIQKED